MINVLIVDDHQLFAQGVMSMFKPEDGVRVTHHTANGHEVPKILDEHPIALILLDIDMPVIDGISTLRLLKDKGYNIPVLMLTMHQSMKQIKGALENGAQGYILKDASKNELLEAIIKASQHQNYFHPKVHEQIFDYFRGKNVSKVALNQLSEREKEIIKCLAEGLNSKAIGIRLFISEHTVKTHRRNIMHKMNVKTSAELVRQAIAQGVIELP